MEMDLGNSLVSSVHPVLQNNLRIDYQLLLLSEQIYSKISRRVGKGQENIQS